ncbi:MAG: ABC transporter permease [Caldilineaceae bacterium]|nr:ABC transporter permease [Caldilineaceae bacterium]
MTTPHKPLVPGNSTQPANQLPAFHVPVFGLWRGLNRFSGLILLSLRRLRHYLGLNVLALVGVVVAVGLVTSAGFFSQAVDTVVMRQELAEYSRITGRPPFSMRVFNSSTPAVPLSLEWANELGKGIGATLSQELGLPVSNLLLQVNSGILAMQTERSGSTVKTNVNIFYQDGIADHMSIAQGIPLDESAASGAELDVWIHTRLAAKIGMDVGDTLSLSPSSSEQSVSGRVVGVWQAADPKDGYWLADPDQSFQDGLVVRRADYISHVEPILPIKVRAATWRITLDESQANPADGRRYVSGLERAPIIIDRFLPGARVTSPSLPLEKFVNRQTNLTTLLLGFNVPGLGFLLYFLVLTSAVIAYWQRREVAMLVSRGMGRLTVLNFTFVEAMILFLIGAPIGLAFGIGLARLMGYAASFLVFDDRPPLPVSWLGINWRLILLTLGIVLLARLWSAAVASRESAVSQERENVRPSRGPFWYRSYLDLLLIIPTAYAYDQLSKTGSLGSLAGQRPEDIFQDPLLVLVPALFIVSIGLLAMRPFPLLMRVLDMLAQRTNWLPLHLSLRQLSRQSHTYINPLLLVIVSLALGVYTFSMAASLDQWLQDRIFYSIGADVSLEPFSEMEAMRNSMGADWIPPADEYAQVPGVAAATRIGDYTAEIRLSTGSTRGRFLGIDRSDFAQVAWFRRDLANESLGSLMNRLALAGPNVLVSEKFYTENLLSVGDRMNILVLTDAGASITEQFIVAGVYKHFPTVDEDETTIVGNLDYLFSFYPVTMPHNIWLRLDEGANSEAVLAAIPRVTGVDAIRKLSADSTLDIQRAQMERVGVFGTLSVSFVMSALMAALGLLTYSYASLNERLFHFSVLRAIGMRRAAVAAQVMLEYAILTAYGAVVGVLVGSYAAELFVPLFRVGSGPNAPLPPLLPIIAGEEILPMVIAFAGLMVVLELAVLSSALYRRIFVALRMGYTG